MDTSSFYQTLYLNLPQSNQEQRENWAKTIVDQGISLHSLLPLLKEDYKISSRFSWLLSNIGIYHKPTLTSILPTLLELKEEVKAFNLEHNLIKYWNISGIPKHQEGIALDILFKHLISSKTQVSIKSQILPQLYQLSILYPEIKPEFILCLEEEKTKHTPSFHKKVATTLKKLG